MSVRSYIGPKVRIATALGIVAIGAAVLHAVDKEAKKKSRIDTTDYAGA